MDRTNAPLTAHQARLRPVVSDEQALPALRELWDEAFAEEEPNYLLSRLAARRALFATLSRHWSARPQELCSLMIEPFVEQHPTVDLPRFPQGRTSSGELHQTMYVTPEIRKLADRWLTFREPAVDGLSGGTVHHLFVTAWSNHRFGKKYKEGQPLRPQGAERDLMLWFGAYNARWAGIREPLPLRIEPWRRGGFATLLERPASGPQQSR